MKKVLFGFLIVATGLALIGCDNPVGDPSQKANSPPADGDPYWELVVGDDTITGSSVEQIGDSTIVLSASSPAGWTLTFTTYEPLASFMFFNSSNSTYQVEVTVEKPTGSCFVGPGSGGGDFVFLTPGDLTEPIPSGIAAATAVNSCPGFNGFLLGFGEY